MTAVRLAGLGEWIPDTVLSNDAFKTTPTATAPRFVGERTFNDIPRAEGDFGALIEQALAAEANDPFLGVLERRVASAADSARAAEAVAARAALADAGLEGETVDFVLSHSMVADHILPTAPFVAEAIGARKAIAFAVDAVCASVMAQLEVAVSLVASGRARVVVGTQSHLMLRAMRTSHPAAPGLGDGATAFVVASGDGPGLAIRGLVAHTHGDFYDAVVWVRDRPEERELPWWEAGPEFRLGSLRPEAAKALMRDTVSIGHRTLAELATKVGKSTSEIDVLASVQPRGFIPGAIARSFGLPANVAVTTYATRGHLGGSGPIANLLEARRSGRLSPGTNALVYAQGAGFTRGGAWLVADPQ